MGLACFKVHVLCQGASDVCLLRVLEVSHAFFLARPAGGALRRVPLLADRWTPGAGTPPEDPFCFCVRWLSVRVVMALVAMRLGASAIASLGK